MKPLHQWSPSLIIAFGVAIGISLLIAGMVFGWLVIHLLRTGALPMP
jgi:ABC-type cobalamin transport system permease subunit